MITEPLTSSNGVVFLQPCSINEFGSFLLARVLLLLPATFAHVGGCGWQNDPISIKNKGGGREGRGEGFRLHF